MLKSRIMTASILIALVLVIIYLAPVWLFAVFLSFLFILAAWEWTLLIGFDRKRYQWLFALSTIFLGMIGTFFPATVFVFSILFWFSAALYLLKFPRGEQFWHACLSLRLVLGYFLLVPCMVAILWIRSQEQGSTFLLMLLILVWCADIGAYFSGKKYGKHKLAPNISPGKTLQGVYGGFGLVILGMIIFMLIYPNHLFLLYKSIWLPTVIAAFLFSIVGDLFESVVKRFQKVKDSGDWLPGHGGILDRIDSLTAAAPVFAFGLWLLVH